MTEKLKIFKPPRRKNHHKHMVMLDKVWKKTNEDLFKQKTALASIV